MTKNTKDNNCNIEQRKAKTTHVGCINICVNCINACRKLSRQRNRTFFSEGRSPLRKSIDFLAKSPIPFSTKDIRQMLPLMKGHRRIFPVCFCGNYIFFRRDYFHFTRIIVIMPVTTDNNGLSRKCLKLCVREQWSIATFLIEI